ncbi:hypothetical protein AND_005704 [Anopheles darlingi]|uniref:Uncharacterized protein n=1 Tax=Anopheles darlingi TaxID=43151 RepID=W5JE16_ANODA|nr:hypothetical protein AND_005704 [Anopheles darlingi]
MSFVTLDKKHLVLIYVFYISDNTSYHYHYKTDDYYHASYHDNYTSYYDDYSENYYNNASNYAHHSAYRNDDQSVYHYSTDYYDYTANDNHYAQDNTFSRVSTTNHDHASDNNETYDHDYPSNHHDHSANHTHYPAHHNHHEVFNNYYSTSDNYHTSSYDYYHADDHTSDDTTAGVSAASDDNNHKAYHPETDDNNAAANNHHPSSNDDDNGEGYESPKDVLRKPNHQHRKIALYSILAMAFVAFFTLFMIVHEADRKMRRQVIVSSFDNETAIEPSAGGLNTLLTTPFSSSSMVNRTAGQEAAASQEASEEMSISSHREPPSSKRTRRLRYYGEDEGRLHVSRDQLVLHPARTLNPPAPQLVSSERQASAEVVVASRRFDEADQAKPKPFHVKLHGPVPVGFQQQQQHQQQQHQQQQQQHQDHHDSRMNRSVDGIDWGALNIQDVIRQLTQAKRHQQQQQQLYYPYKATAGQPAEFNHPVYQNHRVKFTGIYRHPRKNGDITTLFGAASNRPQEVVLQAPQLINQQLQHVMPDPLYNFKPHDPSDVNLLATEQFRFAPQEQQQHSNQGRECRSLSC